VPTFHQCRHLAPCPSAENPASAIFVKKFSHP
jgi:hypothetical protein